jgi:hypothetical protein
MKQGMDNLSGRYLLVEKNHALKVIQVVSQVGEILKVPDLPWWLITSKDKQLVGIGSRLDELLQIKSCGTRV